MRSNIKRATCACTMTFALAAMTLTARASGPVFSEPSPEQLAAITHPALRGELLRMAQEDQLARSRGR